VKSIQKLERSENGIRGDGMTKSTRVGALLNLARPKNGASPQQRGEGELTKKKSGLKETEDEPGEFKKKGGHP